MTVCPLPPRPPCRVHIPLANRRPTEIQSPRASALPQRDGRRPGAPAARQSGQQGHGLGPLPAGPPAWPGQAWAKEQAERPLYVWRAVAPEGFVALGMVATPTPAAPAPAALRCVPRRWVRPAKSRPQPVRRASLRAKGTPGSSQPVWEGLPDGGGDGFGGGGPNPGVYSFGSARSTRPQNRAMEFLVGPNPHLARGGGGRPTQPGGSQRDPLAVWDDSGTGGREGSLWVTSMGLLLAAPGHQPPEEEAFELREDLKIL